VADFGSVDTKAGFGMVPKFVFRLPELKPGPKALYASLCTNADPHGLLWRSLDRLAAEFSVTRRQVQRWLNDLEAAGLLVRLTKPKNRFLLIRKEAGRDWARRMNLQTVSARRLLFTERGREGARKRWGVATQKSPTKDAEVAAPATLVSPKHDLPNKISSTKEVARQDGASGSSRATNGRTYGLKRLNQNPNAEFIQEKLNEVVAEAGGWNAFAALPADQMVARLSGRCGAGIHEQEIKVALGLT